MFDRVLSTHLVFIRIENIGHFLNPWTHRSWSLNISLLITASYFNFRKLITEKLINVVWK